MKNALLTLPTLLLSFAVSAQISYGGEPRGYDSELKTAASVQLVKLPLVDVDRLKAEDEARIATGKKGPYRFGFNHAVDLATYNAGTWHTYDNGDRLWRVSVKSEGAFAINMEFHEYVIPNGGEVYVYNDRGDHIGAFTAASNGNRPTMGVQPVRGDMVTVEYFEPAEVSGQGVLKIGQITHAYRDPFNPAKDFGDSGGCNNNVICPEGNDWRPQIASVARIIVNGNDHCTGQLINNCNEDGHPYFLTAEHCMGGNTNNWVFQFNWESPTCSPTTNGPENQTVSGASVLTQSAASDVALLELNTPVPSSYNASYTGWDWSGTPSSSNVAIHHPSGDIKKISFDFDPAVSTTWFGTQVWRVNNWEDGTTEGGSSGSGLWNENGHLIGQLSGGSASCSSITDDNYGRFDVSWSVLSPFLGNCGPTLGMYPPVSTVDYDIRVASIDSILPYVCGTDMIEPYVRVRNSGSVDVTSFDLLFSIDNGPTTTINWTGVLPSGQTVDVALPQQTLSNGNHFILVNVSSPNGMADQQPANNESIGSFIVTDPGQNVDLLLTLDDYGSETTWSLLDANGDTIAVGGPYGNGLDGTVVRERFCLVDGCYDLIMRDQFGDGMCCNYGNGDFDVADEYGSILVDGNGAFGASVTENFCLTNTSVNELETAFELAIFPNPTNGMITINSTLLDQGDVDLEIVDAAGRTVRRESIRNASNSIDIDLTVLSTGSYLAVLQGENGRAFGRFMVSAR